METTDSDALALLREHVRAHSHDAKAWQRLGEGLHKRSCHEEAIQAFERARTCGAALRTQARDHALSLSAVGRHDEAAALVGAVQAREPKDFEWANLLGVLLKRAGRLDKALVQFDLARRLRPRSAMPWVNRGNVLDLQGDHAAAGEAFHRAALLDPANAEHWRLHGRSMYFQGRFADALGSLERAMRSAPAQVQLVDLYVRTCAKLGRFEDAMEAARKLCALRPTDAAAQVILARSLDRWGRGDEARQVLESIVEREPGHHEANLLLAAIFGDADRAAANEALRRALSAHADSWQAAERLADSLSRSRHGDEGAHIEEAYAVACALQDAHPAQRLQTARALRTVFMRVMDLPRTLAAGTLDELLPHWQACGVHSSVHYELGQVRSLQDRLALVEWHREWGRRLSASVQPVIPRAMPAIVTGRRMRVGFMSSDLRAHPVGRFVLPLLERYDRDRVEVFCYSYYEGERDRMQAHIESQVTSFRWWPGCEAGQAAARIADDGLDMLFDLGASTAMNKLEVMAYRPARLGASWLGYPHSCGPGEIDCIVVDPYIRPSDPRLLVERPLELPHTWVVVGPRQFQDEPILPGVPQDRQGCITFGTANNPYKFSQECLQAWAAVLRRVPGSRFLFLRPEAATRSFVANAKKYFEQQDVDPARLDFVGVRGTHMAHYNCIDIALDSLPHVGGTTTCEALWMGVPTITLAGPGFPERLSYSNLSNVGLGDLAASTVEEYVEKAAALADDPGRRRHLRANLRSLIANHPLGQVDRFVHDFYASVGRAVAA
jgi:predicted O-linked N-acetylglucosamine transferase (SPINDLY family)